MTRSTTILGFALLFASCREPTRVVPNGAAISAAPAPGVPAGDAGAIRKPGPSPLRPAYAKALEGDMRGALALLERVPDDALDDGERRQRSCMLDRFEHPLVASTNQDAWLAKLLTHYQE